MQSSEGYNAPIEKEKVKDKWKCLKQQSLREGLKKVMKNTNINQSHAFNIKKIISMIGA